MTLRTLGQSDLKITPIGIGAWAIGGGKWEFAWGPQDDKESIAAIQAGLDRGINWIDTAAVYGLGHSETVVGRAIKGLRTRPYPAFLTTLNPTARRRPEMRIFNADYASELLCGSTVCAGCPSWSSSRTSEAFSTGFGQFFTAALSVTGALQVKL